MTKITSKAIPFLFGVAALSGCPGDDAPIDTDNGSTGESTGTTDPTTTTIDPDSTTTPADESSGEMMVCDPACEFGECCVAGSCFNASAPTCDDECTEDQTCICPEGVDPCECSMGAGECMDMACGIDGNYDSCAEANCEAGYACLSAPNPSVTLCALQGCEEPCDCPTPPEGYTATCEALTNDGTLFCSFSCNAGECPDGMSCFNNSFCVWPDEAAGGTEPLYGDCINVDDCEAGLTCVSDAAQSFGWCSVGCAGDMECQPPPGTGDAPAVCAPINEMTDVCQLDCGMDQTCPDGMTCLALTSGPACVWTEEIQGYDNCGLPAVDCPMGETCLDDAMGMGDPTWSVCSQAACADASECSFTVPDTGDAPVACADPTGMGGPNTCYLDCAGGQTCPDGMTCIDSSWCAWPQGMELFADDFETGDFSAGWTVNDVDMQMPAMDVAFVDDAWIVGNQLDGGMAGANLAAISTSWYAVAGVSDDWLISPQIMAGPNTRVYWEARTANPNFPDGYELRISTAGIDPADFLANAELFSVVAEEPSYTPHFVDLAPAGYMAQPVHLAWRNVTSDGALLAVDNVYVTDLP